MRPSMSSESQRLLTSFQLLTSFSITASQIDSFLFSQSFFSDTFVSAESLRTISANSARNPLDRSNKVGIQPRRRATKLWWATM